MTEDVSGDRPAEGRPGRATAWAFAGGLVLAVAAGGALWAREGSDVFLAQAFAALAACF